MKIDLAHESIIKRFKKPIFIAIIFYGIALVIMGLTFLFRSMGAIDVEDHYPWIIMTIVTLLYVVYAAIVVVMNKSLSGTMQRVIYAYVGLVVVGSFTARFVSGLKLSDTGAFRPIYILLIIVFLCVLALSVGFKSTLKFIDKRDAEKLARERDPEEPE